MEKRNIGNLINLHLQQKQIFAWSGYHHLHYKEINNDRIPPVYPTDIDQKHQI